MEENYIEKQSEEQQKISVFSRVWEIVCLSVTTIVLLVMYITNGLSSGTFEVFTNSTAEVSNMFYLQITPTGWTVSILGIIYTWQALWLLYAWSFVFRPSTPRTVSWITLLLYSCGNICNIIWIFVWGNNYPQVAFPFIFFIWAFLVAAISVETYHLNKVSPVMLSKKKYKIDLWITRLLVPNGLVIYATWLTTASHINLGIVLQYYANVSAITAGATMLWLLSALTIIYFALENTVLDRYARFIFMVYPVLIWALSGVMSAHWGKEDPDTNPVLTLLLLLLSIGLLIARITLVTIFAFHRPLIYRSDIIIL